MALKLKREKRTKDVYTLYFKSLKKKQYNNINSEFDDTGSFGAFIEAQMKELRPYKKLYLTTKHKIQKLIMNAQERLLLESNGKTWNDLMIFMYDIEVTCHDIYVTVNLWTVS